MAESKRKRAAPPPAVPVLYIRGPSPELLAALDAWTMARRAQLSATASDAASRRTAANFSRTDLVLDVLADAVRARGDTTITSG